MSKHASHCPKLPWMIDFYSTENGKIPTAQLKAVYAKNNLEYLTNLNFESTPPKKRLTGIICTIGPKTNSIEVLEEMIAAGMTIARIKIPFYSKGECEDVVQNIRTAVDNYSKKIGSMYPVAIALDIRGPEIRTGTLKNNNANEIELIQGNETTITTDPSYEEHVTENMIYVDYQKINEIVEPGDRFYLDNNITLSALEVVGSTIKCIIERAGKLINHASVSLENSLLDLPTVCNADVKLSIELSVDIVIASCVRDKETVLELRKVLGVDGRSILVISKIENTDGVKNIEGILEESDGILISRSDLSMELQVEKLFLVQKMIIAFCNKAGKPVIIAPQVLESMTNDHIPKKSEVLDISNAVLDGADAFMLSRETATGEFPIETIHTLSKICLEAEAAIYQQEIFKCLTVQVLSPVEPIYALSISVVEAAMKCNAAAIILVTTTGRTARCIAKYRPRCPIVSITRYGRIARQLQVCRGIEPIHFIHPLLSNWQKDIRRRIQFGVTYGKYNNFIRAGDSIICVTGSRPGTGFTNCMNIYYASEFDCLDEILI